MCDYETKLTQDRQFHVCVARLMELSNHLQKEFNEEGLKYLLLGLYPFAPHLSSELWSTRFGGADIRKEEWPDFEYLLEQSSQTVPLRVSINGKFKQVIEVDKSILGQPDSLFKIVKQETSLLDQYEDETELKKVISFADKPIVNFILQ